MKRKPHHADADGHGTLSHALRAWRARRDRRPTRGRVDRYGEFYMSPRAVLVLAVAFAVYMLIASLV